MDTQRDAEESFPIWLRVFCGIALLVVIGIGCVAVFNYRQQRHQESVAEANKEVDELIAQGEIAFTQGELDVVEQRVKQARAVSLTSNTSSVDTLHKKLLGERKRRSEAEAEAKRIDDERRQAARLAVEAKEREERLAAEVKVHEERERLRVEAENKEREKREALLAMHKTELDKLDPILSAYWLLLENSVSELRRNIDAEIEKMELESAIAKKESDQDVRRLRMLQLKDQYNEVADKAHSQMTSLSSSLIRKLSSLGYRLPHYFEKRHQEAVDEEFVRYRSAISRCFR